MTEIELKKEIENTRNILNMAVKNKWGTGKILDISRNLDCLIEEYIEINNQKMAAGQ